MGKLQTTAIVGLFLIRGEVESKPAECTQRKCIHRQGKAADGGEESFVAEAAGDADAVEDAAAPEGAEELAGVDVRLNGIEEICEVGGGVGGSVGAVGGELAGEGRDRDVEVFVVETLQSDDGTVAARGVIAAAALVTASLAHQNGGDVVQVDPGAENVGAVVAGQVINIVCLLIQGPECTINADVPSLVGIY